MLLLQGWYANMSSKLKPHINQQRLQKCPKKWRGTSIILDPPKKTQTSWQVWGSLALRGASGDFSPVPRAAVDDDLDGICSRMKHFFKVWGPYWREWKHHWFAGAFLSQRPEWCGDLEVIHGIVISFNKIVTMICLLETSHLIVFSRCNCFHERSLGQSGRDHDAW